MEIVYGHVTDLDPDGLILACGSALAKLKAAQSCSTWGDFATLCDLSWDDFIEDWGEDVEDLTDKEDPQPSEPMRFAEIWGLENVGDLVADPRVAVYEGLVKLKELRSDPRIDGSLEWSDGSPAGHLCCVLAVRDGGIEALEQVLQELRPGQFTLREDAALIRDAFGLAAE